MKANLLHKPLLKKEAMMREIQAVDSEFEGNFPFDSVRAELILAESVTDRTHPCAKFGWGNKKSLMENGEDGLWEDLKTFFEKQYSADRIYVVIQTSLPESKDLSELKTWVKETMGILENKGFGNQNFLHLDSNKQPANPFIDTKDEILAFNS
jgi:nardilysin